MQILNPIAPERLPVKILNTSKRGMCVASTEFLPRGAEVRVSVGDTQFFGKVSYCISRPPKFRAGIELVGRIQRSRDREFHPATED